MEARGNTIVKVGAAVVGPDGHSLLTVRKRGRDVFIVPGGKPEVDEDEMQTLRREIREELDCEIASAEFLLEAHEQAAFEDQPLVLRVYLVNLEGVPRPSSEIVEIAWVDAEWEKSGLRLGSGLTKHIFPALWPGTEMGNRTAVLFSGGRDSTAVAALLHDEGNRLDLLSFSTGMELSGNGPEARRLRREELLAVLGPERLQFAVLDVRALVRKVCFGDLVADIQQDGCQLLLLGQALCLFGAAMRYCRQREISELAFGATGYQSHFPEQRLEVVQRLEAWCARNRVLLRAPGMVWNSELEVKERLWMAGLDGKSWESTSLLADIDDNQPLESCLAYVDRKIPLLAASLGIQN